MSRRKPPEPDQPPNKVELGAGGLHVAIESSEPLTTVKRAALDLLRTLHREQLGARVGTGEGSNLTGFQTEPGDTYSQMPPELNLPHRLVIGGFDDRAH